MTVLHRLLILASILALAAIPAFGGCTSDGAGGGGACVDLDGDGYGRSGLALCTFPDFDCNDDAANINPGEDEICDDLYSVDEDCDGLANDFDPECGICQTFEGGFFSMEIISANDTCLAGTIGQWIEDNIDLTGFPPVEVPGYADLPDTITIDLPLPDLDPIVLDVVAAAGDDCMEASVDFSADPIEITIFAEVTITIMGVEGTLNPSSETVIILDLDFDVFLFNDCTITIQLQGNLA